MLSDTCFLLCHINSNENRKFVKCFVLDINDGPEITNLDLSSCNMFKPITKRKVIRDIYNKHNNIPGKQTNIKNSYKLHTLI